MRLKRGAIERMIRRQGLKRYWLAEVAGIDRTTLRRWMRGRIREVSTERVTRLARALGETPDRIAVPSENECLTH